ncbi:putative F-box protein At4g38870 [Hordeum vulgare subsp. vulgare]|uniref:Uncharacterized protein n=1 Tax=Hordeum vulgare subsp. vulgare TaxID=112509 RepID=M0W5I2_HORVV|nr:putative F-box protein At4g38870 [Hordeum vulgare subsp. vulgare]
MDSEKVLTDASLPDDLVVKVLSRVPFKSFCRFKCVCKAWLAFSSDPHYRQKLPKIPTGLFHGCKDGSVAQLVSLSRNDEEIDGGLTFLPHHEHLIFVDCCNGLVLCQYKSNYTSPNICRFIVCNPATQEWRTLPDIHPDPDPIASRCTTFLAFDPSWSAQFYVFNFSDELPLGINKLELFSSDLSTWTVDATWSLDVQIYEPHHFVGGVLYVHTVDGEILVLKAMGSGIPPRHFTIELPGRLWSLVYGCFGQSSGLLQCVFLEESGDTAVVFSLDAHHSYEWSLKCRVSMRDALGRDDFVHNNSWPHWLGYHIVALDLERGFIFLVDMEQIKLLSYNINTGKLRKIQDDCRSNYLYYVACYSKLPG